MGCIDLIKTNRIVAIISRNYAVFCSYTNKERSSSSVMSWSSCKLFWSQSHPEMLGRRWYHGTRVGWLVGWLVGFPLNTILQWRDQGGAWWGGGGCASQIWLDWQSYYLKYCTKRLRSTRISIWEPKIQTLTSRFTPGPEARILRSLALSCQNVPPKCRSGHAIDTITLTNMAALHLSS